MERLISIGYDHALASHYGAAGWAFNNGGHVGTFYIVTSKIGTQGHLTTDNYDFLVSKGFEIASHSTNHYKFSETPPTPETLDIDIVQSKQTLENLGYTINGYVPPYVYLTQEIIDVVQQHYDYVLYNLSKPQLTSTIPIIQSIGVNKNSTFDAVKQKIDEAIANNTPRCINFHNIVSNPVKQSDVSIQMFKDIVNYLNSINVVSTTHKELSHF